MKIIQNKPFEKIVFCFALTAGIYLASWFIIPTIWGAYLSIGLQPFYRKCLSKLPENKFIAQKFYIIFTATIFILVISLLLLTMQPLFDELTNLENIDFTFLIKNKIDELTHAGALSSVPLVVKITNKITLILKEKDLTDLGAVTSIFQYISSYVSQWGKEVMIFVLSIIFSALSMAIFLKSPHETKVVLHRIASYLLNGKIHHHLTQQKQLIRALFNSFIILSVLETFIFWALYSALGLGHAALLGILTGTLSIIPMVSTLISTATCIYIALNGDLLSAIILGAFSGIILLIADPIARPLLAGKQNPLNFGETTLSMIIGLQSLGIIGIFAGPQIYFFIKFLYIQVKMS